jgi:hypothetical protein
MDDLIGFWDSGSQMMMLIHRRVAPARLQPEATTPLYVKGFQSK